MIPNSFYLKFLYIKTLEYQFQDHHIKFYVNVQTKHTPLNTDSLKVGPSYLSCMHWLRHWDWERHHPYTFQVLHKHSYISFYDLLTRLLWRWWMHRNSQKSIQLWDTARCPMYRAELSQIPCHRMVHVHVYYL